MSVMINNVFVNPENVVKLAGKRIRMFDGDGALEQAAEALKDANEDPKFPGIIVTFGATKYELAKVFAKYPGTYGLIVARNHLWELWLMAFYGLGHE